MTELEAEISHQITEDELVDYVEQKRREWTQFACSSGYGHIKKLEFSIRHVGPIYRVSYQGQFTYVGAMKETAVREYNALP